MMIEEGVSEDLEIERENEKGNVFRVAKQLMNRETEMLWEQAVLRTVLGRL